jgi:glyoxylase-like metal-dependent hydrolase (beta-lactamase superfamily II)
MTASEVLMYRGGSISQEYVSGMAAVLVRHPRALFLFDSGFGARVDEHVKSIPALMRATTNYDGEIPAAAQLIAGGIDLNKIAMIIVSHSHWDHVSGLVDFPGTETWMSRAEIAYSWQLPAREVMRQVIDKLALREIEFTDGAYENYDSSYDLFKDGSIVLVPQPGHTPGSLGMFVNLKSGKRYFFIGDLTWTIEGVRNPAERPWLARTLVDKDAAVVRREIVRVHNLALRYPEMVIVPAHDRRLHDSMPLFPTMER